MLTNLKSLINIETFKGDFVQYILARVSSEKLNMYNMYELTEDSDEFVRVGCELPLEACKGLLRERGKIINKIEYRKK